MVSSVKTGKPVTFPKPTEAHLQAWQTLGDSVPEIWQCLISGCSQDAQHRLTDALRDHHLMVSDNYWEKAIKDEFPNYVTLGLNTPAHYVELLAFEKVQAMKRFLSPQLNYGLSFPPQSFTIEEYQDFLTYMKDLYNKMGPEKVKQLKVPLNIEAEHHFILAEIQAEML